MNKLQQAEKLIFEYVNQEIQRGKEKGLSVSKVDLSIATYECRSVLDEIEDVEVFIEGQGVLFSLNEG